jgi:hypothetical protein
MTIVFLYAIRNRFFFLIIKKFEKDLAYTPNFSILFWTLLKTRSADGKFMLISHIPAKVSPNLEKNYKS